VTAVLQRFFNVRREELLPILMAAVYFFCVLTALMILRPTRDALGMQRGIDEVRWLFNGTLVLTLIVSPLFSLLVARYKRMVFISATHAFFILNLLLFCGVLLFAPQAVGERTGQVFYVWMSVFNLFITMMFWALMADRFSFEQSKRIFGVIAVGGTLGAMTGSTLVWNLAEIVGAPMMLALACVFLVFATGAAWAVASFQPEQQRAAGEGRFGPDTSSVIGGSAWEGMRAVFRSPYLLGISAYVLILAVMVTFIYFTRLQMVAAAGDSVDFRTGLFAQMDFFTQAATLLLQLIVVGHVMKRFGVAFTMAVLPVTVALGFIGLAIVGSIVALVLFDATQRAVQRAIMRPARETLWTVVSREEKYKAKAFIDTFIYRAGDAVGAQTEGALGRLGMGLYALAIVAVPLAVLWGALGIWLGRQQARLARENGQVGAPTAASGAVPHPRTAS
jgi:ATP:ADP antiporter, AAA family